MRILGIDPSLTATGAVLLDDSTIEHSRTECRPSVVWAESWKPPKGVVGADRLCWFDEQIRAALVDVPGIHGDGRVAFEGYSYGSISHAHALGEQGGVFRLAVATHLIPYVEIPPSTWRKELFGRGRLEKDQVRLKAFQRYSVEFESMDVTEAWCIAMTEWRRRTHD